MYIHIPIATATVMTKTLNPTLNGTTRPTSSFFAFALQNAERDYTITNKYIHVINKGNYFEFCLHG